MQDTTLLPSGRAMAVEQTPSLIEEATSPNTLRMRRSAACAWAEFVSGEWLYAYRDPGGAKKRRAVEILIENPPDKVTMVAFIEWMHRQKHRAYETTQSYVSHLNVMCKLYRDESPRSHPKVAKTLAAARKLNPPLKHHSKPITSAVLTRLMKDATPLARAAFMTAYTFSLRTNELRAICGRDVEMEGPVMKLTIPKSKTSAVPETVSAKLYTATQIGVQFSHKNAMTYLKEVFGDGRLFPMSPEAYKKMIFDACLSCGLDPREYSATGFRSGRLTDLLEKYPPHWAMLVSRHTRPETLLKHYRQAELDRMQIEMSEITFKQAQA